MEDTKQRSWVGEQWGGEIFLAFRIAIHPRKMVAAFMAVAVICGVGWLMDLTRSVVVDSSRQITELSVYINQPDKLPEFIETWAPQEGRAGVFATLFRFASDRFHTTLYSWFRIEQLQTVALPETVGLLRDAVKSLGWAFRFHPIYSIVFFAIASVVLAIAGGAICRMAALQLALNERPGLVESLRFSCIRVVHFLSAFWIPLIIVVVFGASVTLLALLGNIGWLGELLVALSMPLVLLAGVIMVFFIIGVAAGSGLMSPAVAYEDSESFTAINNAFRYVYARPWRLGFFSFLAALYGAMTYLFVRFFSFATLLVSYRFLQLGFVSDNAKLIALWSEPTFVELAAPIAATSGSWTMAVSRFVIYLCALTVAGVVGSYILSYYYSVSTIIYALLRRHVDGIAISEIHIQGMAVETPQAPSVE